MRYLSLFSGIEAATVAWKQLGWECVAVAEIEPNPCTLLAHHYPNVPNLGDITKITEAQIKALGRIDLVVFGSPCQDLSLAGNRQGFNDGTRSSLFFDAIRLIQWARQHGACRFALWENVFGAFSSNEGRDFASVVSHMAGLRDVTTPKNGWGNEGCAVGDTAMLEWCVLDAQWFGVAQRRRRVFALADFGDWANRPPILLERRSLRGNNPPSREAGKNPAVGTLRSTNGGSDVDHAQAGHLRAVTIMAHGQGGAEVSSDRAPTLTCNHEAPIAVYSLTFCDANGRRSDRPDGGLYITENPDTSPTLTTQIDSSIRVLQHAYAFQPRIARNGRGDMGDIVNALTAEAGETGKGDAAPCVAIAFSCKDYGADATNDLAPTMRSMGHDGSHANGGGQLAVSLPNMAVRRLTPRECERLQGFQWLCDPSYPGAWRDDFGVWWSPDYTLVPVNGKLSADAPRYKALGNSMAVPVMRHIGERIDAAIRLQVT